MTREGRGFGTYSAEGGGVALVVRGHSFHWVLLSHLEQKRREKLKALAAEGASTHIHSAFSSILPMKRAERFLCTGRTRRELSLCTAKAMPRTAPCRWSPRPGFLFLALHPSAGG